MGGDQRCHVVASAPGIGFSGNDFLAELEELDRDVEMTTVASPVSRGENARMQAPAAVDDRSQAVVNLVLSSVSTPAEGSPSDFWPTMRYYDACCRAHTRPGMQASRQNAESAKFLRFRSRRRDDVATL